jgi:sec-independent protein translocase protein TatC
MSFEPPPDARLPIADGDPGSDPVEDFRMPLLEHVRELRNRIMVMGGVSFVAVLVAFVYVDPIWALLVTPMNTALEAHGVGSLAIHSVVEGFMTKLKVAALAGIIGVCPILFHQIWGFVAPGLYPNEKKTVVPMVIASTLLFLVGGAFAYTVIFSFAFPFFLEITPVDVLPVLSIGDYLSVATKLILAFGACFQLPVVIFFLARAGAIDHLDLLRAFRYAVVAIFVVSALLTPPDVLSQFLMAGPLVLLYGIGIVVAWGCSTKERDD